MVDADFWIERRVNVVKAQAFQSNNRHQGETMMHCNAMAVLIGISRCNFCSENRENYVERSPSLAISWAAPIGTSGANQPLTFA
jgi:hypothetical protein